MTAVELDDTTTCPTGESCEVCGDTDDLAVGTAGTMFGVYCLTLCAECYAGPLPALPLLTALTRVGEHCAHLGIDLDLMSEGDRQRGRSVSAAALTLAAVALGWCAGLTAYLAAGRGRGRHRGTYSGGERR